MEMLHCDLELVEIHVKDGHPYEWAPKSALWSEIPWSNPEGEASAESPTSPSSPRRSLTWQVFCDRMAVCPADVDRIHRLRLIGVACYLQDIAWEKPAGHVPRRDPSVVGIVCGTIIDVVHRLRLIICPAVMLAPGTVDAVDEHASAGRLTRQAGASRPRGFWINVSKVVRHADQHQR